MVINSTRYTLCELFKESLFDVNSEKVAEITKSLLNLSRNESNRLNCFSIGLTSDICKWFLRCNDYFIGVSNSLKDESHAEAPVEVTVSENILSVATDCLRALRNMCTECKPNQREVVNCGIPDIICSLVQDKHLWAAGNMQWSERYEQLILISLQLLCNVVSGNEDGKDCVWKHFFPNCFQCLLQYYSHNSKLSSMSSAVLHYCLCSAKTEAPSRQRLLSLINDNDSINLLFSYSVSGEKDEPSDWVYYLASLILSCSIEDPSIFSSLFASLSSKSFPVVSPTQLVLFHYVLQILDDTPNMELGDNLCGAIIELIVQLAHSSATLMEEKGRIVFNQDLLEKQRENSVEGRNINFFIEGFGLLLTILAGQIVFISESFRSTILQSELFSILLAVLAIPEIDIDDSATFTGDKQATAMILQRDDVWTSGTRDSALQLLGNIVDGSVNAQNQMREMGAIELVLNHTKMHPKHPLQREWALFTIRNLCLGNEENQRYISEFKVERVAADPALSKLGVKVSVEDGKPKITKE